MKTVNSLFIVPVLVIAFLIDNNNGGTKSSQAALGYDQAPVNSFAFFRTHRQGRGITATWGMTSRTGVNSYLMEKTYEDPTDPYANWENVCSQACSGVRSYKFTDNNVLPGYITYRVTAHLQGGGTVVSEYSTEHIVAH